MADTSQSYQSEQIDRVDSETTGSSQPRKKQCPLRILIVDDDDQIRLLLVDILAIKGYHVIACRDGCSALEAFRNDEFDIVITDLGMPGMSGLDLAGLIHQENPRTPVALLTGWGSQVDPDQVALNGVRAIVAKPFRFEQIIALVEKLSGNRQ